MSFAVNWPTFSEETETQLCSTLNELLKEAKMDANLIRGQFEVRGVSIGSIPPTVTLMGVNTTSLEELSVEVCLQYDDQQCEGFAITIGGAEIALTGEADDPAFAPSKLWYPFEVTLYNIKIIAKAQIDVSLPTLRQIVTHKPPPAFALHELQLGRLRAARTPVVDERKVSTPSSSGRGPYHYQQHTLTSVALKEVSLPCDSIGPPSTSTPQKVLKNAGFGFAYASRRVHYPKWPRTSDANRQTNYCDTSSTAGTVRSRSDNCKITPSQQSLSTNIGRRGMTTVPSLISLETSNSVGSYNTVGMLQNLERGQEESSSIPEVMSSPQVAPSSPDYPSETSVTILFSGTPRVDFFLRTNFRQLKGADEQTKSILMSLLRPKLEELLRGIIIKLPEKTVELGTGGKPSRANMYYQSP